MSHGFELQLHGGCRTKESFTEASECIEVAVQSRLNARVTGLEVDCEMSKAVFFVFVSFFLLLELQTPMSGQWL